MIFMLLIYKKLFLKKKLCYLPTHITCNISTFPETRHLFFWPNQISFTAVYVMVNADRSTRFLGEVKEHPNSSFSAYKGHFSA